MSALHSGEFIYTGHLNVYCPLKVNTNREQWWAPFLGNVYNVRVHKRFENETA